MERDSLNAEIHGLYRRVSSPAAMPVAWQPGAPDAEDNAEANADAADAADVADAAEPMDDAVKALSFSSKLDETMQNMIAYQGETAVFACKLVGSATPPAMWYKDGVILHENCRTPITEDGAWRRLEINRAQFSDQGIYTIKCRYNGECISSTARLFVAPRHISAGAFYYDWENRGLGVIKHLKNVDVFSGSRIILEASFKQASNEYIWFKNNSAIHQDDRTIILNDRYSATLSMLNAETTDTGVYFVVSKARNGYVASHADVQVREHDEQLDELPAIIEMLPEEVEPFLGQEIRMNVKVSTDRHTIIRWQKDGGEIDLTACTPVDYGNNYIGLQIPSPTMSAVGLYNAILTNERTTKTVNTFTNLTVCLYPMKAQPEVRLVRPLESAVAVPGARVSFDCSFDLEDPIYFYVVWYVGHYKVERTNSLFHVLCGGGQYVLYIERLLWDMGGEVVCELRRAWPGNKWCAVARAQAHLAVAPLRVLHRERKRLAALLPPKLSYELLAEPGSVRIGHDEARAAAQPPDSTPSAPPPPAFLLKIVYSRLDAEGLCFVHAWRAQPGQPAHAAQPARLLVYDKRQLEPGNGTKITVFQWSGTSPSRTSWYLVELGQADGSFAKAGVTSVPQFQVEDPPVERLMLFRITAVAPLTDVRDSAVYIVPPPDSVVRPFRPQKPQPMEDFEAKYTKTDDLIGVGAFGSVQVVVNKHDGVSCAAKFIKMKFLRKEDAILREFKVMNRLSHRNLIDLIDFYMSKTLFVFVMDYCWGGELFDRIVEEEHIKEADMVGYIRQLCEGLEYVHGQNIVHLDVKPENIICLHPNCGRVKLIDFGLARQVTAAPVKALYGTRDYVAPEVLGFEPVTTACDMWSLGVLVYMCLSGILPFSGDSWPERCANITRANYNFDDSAFDEISDVAKDFVDHLLIKRPRSRLTASGALAHRWVREGPPLGAASAHMKKARANLKSYLAIYRSKWQRAGNVMIAAHRLRTWGRHEAAAAAAAATSSAGSAAAGETKPPAT